MGEVKGGIVINQMKQYAKRLSDATGSSSMVQLDVWCHKYGDGEEFNVYVKAFSCKKSDTIKPRFETEDLRELGIAIEDYVGGNK
jgi:hypothetical protein